LSFAQVAGLSDGLARVSGVSLKCGTPPIESSRAVSLELPSGPGSEETCSGTGSTRGTGTILEAMYAQMIYPGEGDFIAGNNQRFRVVDVVPFEEEDESPFVGMLRIEAAA
jgi:hypothetical protein